ncbi:hypothetical protein JCM10207_002065 [Rhodosporidiobolus poonsookiae]
MGPPFTPSKKPWQRQVTLNPSLSRPVTPVFDPHKKLAPTSSKAPLSPKSGNSSTVFSTLPVAPAKDATPVKGSGVDVGWRAEDGETVIVKAPLHSARYAPHSTWLHAFEHARYLHAGVPESAVRWNEFALKVEERVERPALAELHDYLSSLPSISKVKRPDPSLWTEIPYCESRPEIKAAFMKGTVHFTGGLYVVKDPAKSKDRLAFRLNPPVAGMGSALYRRFGSDRFFRIAVDDEVTRRAPPSFDSGKASSRDEDLRAQIRLFFAHPLFIFGRTYRPFCWKDGAAVYWCESGDGIPTISLVDFAQRYLDVELNGNMSVAKYAARFELGLTTTTPTTVFRRNQVFRTPDLTSDSLKLSVPAMRAIVARFRQQEPAFAAECLPGAYLPSAIRATARHGDISALAIDIVYQLDYSPAHSSDSFIEAHPFSWGKIEFLHPAFTFQIEAKDGTVKEVTLAEGFEVRWVKPKKVKKRDDEVVMTDGCSLMSTAAMHELARKHAATDLDPDMPAVAQGRIGGGKGVWAKAPPTPWNTGDEVWIEIRDSQWKFKDRQTSSFTFELHSIPSGKGSTKLGKQMFEVLAHCGVPTTVFREMLKQQVQTGLDAFFHPESLAALLYHVERTSSVLQDRTLKARAANDPSSLKRQDSDVLDEDEPVLPVEESASFVHDGRLDGTSGAPNTVAEVVVEMLQAGFDPAKSPHLADKLRKVSTSWIQRQVSWKLDDEFSRTAFVIADHFGILSEGEFFFQTTDPIPLANKQGKTHIVIGDALLSRSPAIQPCDVQLAKGVFRVDFLSFHNVIIVSTRGERSLCSILSGGDYDGDKLVVCTNPALVKAFDPKRADPNFADPPFKDDDWFEVDRRKVKSHVLPLIQEKDNDGLAVVFMEGLFSGTQYGQLSVWHTTLAYTLGLDHKLTSEVGHLFCRALDGRKQGLSFSEPKWLAARAKFNEAFRDKPRWTWCEDGKKAPSNVNYAKRPKKLGRHAMDELVEEGEDAVREAANQWTKWCEGRVVEIDPDLTSEWVTAWETTLRERDARTPGSVEYFEDLQTILAHVRHIKEEYSKLFQEWRRSKERRMADEKAAQAPGSPTKSPSKKKGEWRASSKSQKEELLDLSRRFWSILEEGKLRSQRLEGESGARAARALMASCAYTDLLQPTPAPPALGAKPLLQRLQAASPSHTSSVASSSTATVVATPTTLSHTSTKVSITVTEAKDADGDEVFHDAEESFEDDDFPYSQVADTASQAIAAASAFVSSTTTSQTLTASSSHPSAPPSPTPLAHAPVRTVSEPRGLNKRQLADFSSASQRADIRFVFDMAHRDVLALKADAATRRLHQGNKGAVGIQAPKLAPHMLDVLAVSKRCAGITQARAKVRPRTLLPEPDDQQQATSGGSPAKKLRRV